MHERNPGTPARGRALRVVSAASLACAYLLVVLGDTVRVTESGMGCRSWPLCNGQAGLTGNYHALLEQSHRYLAAVVSVLVVTTFVVAWRQARRDRLVFRAAATAAVLIGVQVVLGAITVFAHNAGWTVALHLAGAWLLAGAVTVTSVAGWQAPGRAPALTRTAVAGWQGPAAVVSLLVLSVSGMVVLHGGASRACPGWPACGLGTGPAALVLLQYLHRALALVAAVLVIAASVRAWRSPVAGPAGRVLAAASVVLLTATVTIGAVTATTGAPPLAQDLHLAVGSALWIAVVALAALAGTAPAPGAGAGPAARLAAGAGPGRRHQNPGWAIR